MWIIKLLGIVIVVLVSAFTGFLKSNMLAERYKKLSAIYDGTNNLYEYVQNSGCELFEAVKNSYSGINFLHIKNGAFMCDYNALTKEDTKLIDAFFISLGASAKKIECDKINNFRLKLNTHIKQAKTNYEQKGKIYQTFGICIGLTIAVLLI